jgi:hypothetical protein
MCIRTQKFVDRSDPRLRSLKNLKEALEDVGSNFDAPGLGDDPRGDVEGRRDWWAG